MSNALAVSLVALVIAFVLLDALVLRWGAPLYAARAGLDLIRWAAFWR